MIRSLAMLVPAIRGATFVLPLLAFGRAKDPQKPGANGPPGPSHSDASQSAARSDASHSEGARHLRSFLEADWRRWMTEHPAAATHVGVPGLDGRWTDVPPAGIAHRKKHLADRLAALKSIPRADLPAGEQLNFDLYLE